MKNDPTPFRPNSLSAGAFKGGVFTGAGGAVLALAFGVILALQPWAALAAGEPCQADFEAPLYQPGSIAGQHGWSVEQGSASVVAGAGRNGGAGLVLEPLQPFSQATFAFPAASPAGTSSFLDFHLKATAGSENLLEEMLDIDGARIGFFRSPDAPGKGRFWIFEGDKAGGGQWRAVGLPVPLDASGNQSAEWVRLTVRQDFETQSWDLWLNGKVIAASIGFQDSGISKSTSYVIMGDSVGKLVMDDFSAGKDNVFGKDSDGDGICDSDEAAIGSNPDLKDRDGSDEAGIPYLEKWLRMHAQAAESARTVPAPVFSRASAVESEPFTLTLSAPGGAAIFYTTDGTRPVPGNSHTYSGPIPVSSTKVIRACVADASGKLSSISAGAWVFPQTVGSQQLPSNWPESIGEPDPVTGGMRLFSLDPRLHLAGSATDGAADLPSSEGVAAALSKAPIVVINADPEELFGANGVYSRASTANASKASGEITWMEGGSARGPGFAGEAAISVSGQSSRSHAVTLKHSLRVSWPATTDAGLVFGKPAFPCRQILLRNPTHDSWTVDGVWSSRRQGARYITDSWTSAWMATQGHENLAHRWVHVFLNGTYWGVYDAVEQHDEAYPSRHGLRGTANLVEPDVENGRAGVRSIVGTATGWSATLQALKEAAVAGNAATDADWEKAASALDLPGLTDYVLWNWYLANADWPAQNWLASQESGKWRMISWDAEMALPVDGNELPSMAARLSGDVRGPGAAFVLLSNWPEFRRRVAVRLDELCQEGGALDPAVTAQSWHAAAATFRDLVPAESARWGAYYQTPALVPADWEKTVARVDRKFFPGRTAGFRQEVDAFLKAREAEQATRANEVPSAPPAPAPLAPVVDVPVDSDGDRIPDEWELRFGLNPGDASDALQDKDGDGLSNLDEYFRQSNPASADEVRNSSQEGPSVHTRFAGRQRRKVAAPAK